MMKQLKEVGSTLLVLLLVLFIGRSLLAGSGLQKMVDFVQRSGLVRVNYVGNQAPAPQMQMQAQPQVNPEPRGPKPTPTLTFQYNPEFYVTTVRSLGRAELASLFLCTDAHAGRYEGTAFLQKFLWQDAVSIYACGTAFAGVNFDKTGSPFNTIEIVGENAIRVTIPAVEIFEDHNIYSVEDSRVTEVYQGALARLRMTDYQVLTEAQVIAEEMLLEEAKKKAELYSQAEQNARDIVQKMLLDPRLGLNLSRVEVEFE